MGDVRPGRPRTFDTERVLDDAMDLFWRRGYRSTTTRDLEASLGVTQSSLYHAFGSKAQLLDCALERYQTRLDHELLEPLRTGADGLGAIDVFLGGLSAWLLADGTRGCLLGKMMSESDPPESVVASRVAAWHEEIRAALTAALVRACEAGEIHADNVDDRVALIVGIVLGMNLAVNAGFGELEVKVIGAAGRAEVARWRLGG
jgi:AcrR family transcriptional regulator